MASDSEFDTYDPNNYSDEDMKEQLEKKKLREKELVKKPIKKEIIKEDKGDNKNDDDDENNNQPTTEPVKISVESCIEGKVLNQCYNSVDDEYKKQLEQLSTEIKNEPPPKEYEPKQITNRLSKKIVICDVDSDSDDETKPLIEKINQNEPTPIINEDISRPIEEPKEMTIMERLDILLEQSKKFKETMWDCDDIPVKENVKEDVKPAKEDVKSKLINVKKAPYDLKPNNKELALINQKKEIEAKYTALLDKHNKLVEKYNKLKTNEIVVEKATSFYKKFYPDNKSVREFLEDYDITYNTKDIIRVKDLYEAFQLVNNTKTKHEFIKILMVHNILTRKLNGNIWFYGIIKKPVDK